MRTNPIRVMLIMERLLTVTAFMYLSILQASAQTLSINRFELGETSLGAYVQFQVQVINDRSFPIRWVGSMCTGLGSVQTSWHGFDSAAMKPDRGVNATLVIVPKTMSDISQICYLQFADTSGNLLPPVEYMVTALVTKAAILTANATTIDFGDVELGDEADTVIVVKNSGNGDASLYRWTQHSTIFSVDHLNYIVKAGDSLAIPVTFTPSELADYSGDVILGYLVRDIEPPLTIHFKGKGIFPNSGLLPEYFGQPVMFGIWQQTTDTRTLKFTTTSPEVIVVGIALRVGTAYTMKQQSLPVVVDPTHPLLVDVTWDPSQSPVPWEDILDVTTEQGKVASVVLRGAVLTSVEGNVAANCHPYPNPTVGEVRWCGVPLQQWRVVDEFGVVVAQVSADADGRVEWRGDQPGFYMAVSERTGKAIPFIVLK